MKNCGYRWVPGTGQKKIFGYRWVPGTGQKKNYGYRWVPGTSQIKNFGYRWVPGKFSLMPTPAFNFKTNFLSSVDLKKIFLEPLTSTLSNRTRESKRL